MKFFRIELLPRNEEKASTGHFYFESYATDVQRTTHARDRNAYRWPYRSLFYAVFRNLVGKKLLWRKAVPYTLFKIVKE